ncbi:histone-like nucleoid-structuring protein Lsr2 [Amycolatopsis sp. cmx-4-61]|uniref:histone-like nucleoid-structuring protein Lsr2 n=1 Tax=Amycolatopsis sp. cmx-4-61 TaxID=2790937 RepID=UPI003979768B
MAQKVRVEVLDDLDGGEAAETVAFGLDGVSYEIDLSAENAEALRGEFERFVQAARRVGGRRVKVALGQSTSEATRSSGTGKVNSREYNQQVREWAAANGYEVAERGRLSSELIEAYETARTAPAEVEAEPAEKPARKRAPRKKAAV